MKRRLLALLLSLLLPVSCFPLTAFAQEAFPETAEMVEGDVQSGFVPAGTPCTSADPAIAWVDTEGNLNALKEGSTTISVEGQGDCTVTVSDYTDGSDVVGSLKILARYNDSMQFYDGHVYLLFTSYQDGVTITVPDLYGGYQIDDEYYTDINEDIANGSNHTGNTAEKYFTFDDSMTSVTLDRGEIVTIGMYRGFDLSVAQAALGSIQNSSAWKSLSKEVKSAITKVLFEFLNTGKASAEEAIARIKAIMTEAGEDYQKLLDGVVEGGVCFNRELYNQKLEWDQFENVTYELDITEKQLNMMNMYLYGNNGKFSILKNSCATVALRAWNAAVGTRNGADTAYKLSCQGEGVFALVDAPKGVRDGIVNRLPGYYLNNAQGVAEPDAGFEDETGCVYVSAPEKVSPLNYVYADDSIVVDSDRTGMSALLSAAKAGQKITYHKDAQQVNVTVQKSGGAVWKALSGIDFEINGTTVGLSDLPEGGVWFKAKIDAPDENANYYILDSSGKAIASDYEDGYIGFCAEALPLTFKIVSEQAGTKNILKTAVKGGDCAETEIYYYKDGVKTAIEGKTQLDSGTKVYIKSTLRDDDGDHLLSDIVFNDESLTFSECYDAEEDAYFVTMPEKYSKLQVVYENAVLEADGATLLQISIGDELAAADCTDLVIGNGKHDDRIVWVVIDDGDGAVKTEGGKLTAVKEGTAFLIACAEGNLNICVPFTIEVYEDVDKLVGVTFDDQDADFCITMQENENETPAMLPFSGYRVKSGTVLNAEPDVEEPKALLYIVANDNIVKSGERIIADKDTDVKAYFADAVIEGMPDKVNLTEEDETFKLDAAVKYTGLLKYLPVYDPSITYESSDPLIAVDENGLISVTGEIPEGGKAVYVTAYAGSSNRRVCAQTRVIVGDYDGDAVVGKLTIYSRRISQNEMIPHGCVVFTTYEDVDLDVSYYEYYKPDDRYNALMTGYELDPDSFPSDPALYSNNDLELEDRESYFEIINHGSNSDPAPVSLKAGESITMSNYSFDPNNFSTFFKTIENGTISDSKETKELIRQLKAYQEGGEIDGEAAFDSMVATFMQIYAVYKQTGYVIADGSSIGGLCVNRELYNEFRRNDLQTPSTSFAVEITADELAQLQKYIANPDHNYYSLFNMNCASGAVAIWNTTLADRPQYLIKGNYTGVAVDPMSLYADIALMGQKDIDGDYIVDFYPRTVAFIDDVLIGDVDGDGQITVFDASLIQRYLASQVTEDKLDLTAADVDGDGKVTIFDASLIQRYLSGASVARMDDHRYELL